MYGMQRTLKNGAEILVEAPHRRDHNAHIVLARWHDELVSWWVDGEYNAFWGRYGDSAIPAFVERCGFNDEVLTALEKRFL